MKKTAAAALLLLCGVRAELRAQSGTFQSEAERQPWLETWSPLQARANLPRRLPSVGMLPSSLLFPAPKVGLFWTAGNPAGLRDELSGARTDYTASLARESGSLRRPLDPAGIGVRRAEIAGWRLAGERLALLGRVVVDEEQFEPGSRADVIESHPTSPFITLDTASTATQRTRARLEGALGLTLASWRLGAAFGYEAHDRHTLDAGFVRRGRQVIPGATLGVARALGPVRFSAYARLRARAETVQLLELEAEGVAIQLEGFREVRSLDILGEYYRRIDEVIPSAGAAVAGTAAGGMWTLYGERNSLRETLTRQRSDEPEVDTWRSAGWTAGAGYGKEVTRRASVTLNVRHATLSGDGDVALDSAGTIVRAAERATIASLHWRARPDGSGWGYVLHLQSALERRHRDALTVPVASRITGLTSTVSVEVGRMVNRRLFATGSLGVGAYSANSSIPAPFAMGRTYQTFIVPEYDLMGRAARTWLVGGGVRWTLDTRRSLMARLAAEQLSATEEGATAFGPRGSRRHLSAMIGLTLLGQ